MLLTGRQEYTDPYGWSRVLSFSEGDFFEAGGISFCHIESNTVFVGLTLKGKLKTFKSHVRLTRADAVGCTHLTSGSIAVKCTCAYTFLTSFNFITHVWDAYARCIRLRKDFPIVSVECGAVKPYGVPVSLELNA